MYDYTINNSQYGNYSTIRPIKSNAVNKCAPNYSSPVVKYSDNLHFGASLNIKGVRCELANKDEKNKYSQLLEIADKDTKKQLNILLKSGILLNNDSNDNSTVLDNLYTLATNERAKGLNNITLLKETVDTLVNPYIITQQFGNIPQKYLNQVKLLGNGEDVNVEHSGTCVASSIEFNLAQKHPAEFARFAQGLSSPEMSVNKKIKLSNLADNTLDAVWLLNAFEIPYEAKDFNEAVLKFAPDKNAIVRAHIQTVDKDKYERSSLDVLMQSTFMQVGSQQSYNTLTDKRAGKFNQNDKGLIEFEKTFTESVVEDKNKISVTYQKVDENAKLIGYEMDFETIKRQIIEALKSGDNVIIGYTQTDENNTIVNGHEITITDVKLDKNGKMIFICNDTDDGISRPVEYSEDYLLEKIHHAALPQNIVRNDINITENWQEGLKTYKELKAQQYNKAA